MQHLGLFPSRSSSAAFDTFGDKRCHPTCHPNPRGVCLSEGGGVFRPPQSEFLRGFVTPCLCQRTANKRGCLWAALGAKRNDLAGPPFRNSSPSAILHLRWMLALGRIEDVAQRLAPPAQGPRAAALPPPMHALAARSSQVCPTTPATGTSPFLPFAGSCPSLTSPRPLQP